MKVTPLCCDFVTLTLKGRVGGKPQDIEQNSIVIEQLIYIFGNTYNTTLYSRLTLP